MRVQLFCVMWVVLCWCLDCDWIDSLVYVVDCGLEYMWFRFCRYYFGFIRLVALVVVVFVLWLLLCLVYVFCCGFSLGLVFGC